jgi:hypothetical protein
MTAVAELAEGWEGIELPAAAAMAAHAVLDSLGSSKSGLVPEATGPDPFRCPGARIMPVHRRGRPNRCGSRRFHLSPCCWRRTS